jgi:5-oxoprolinase (ATP-hydrolysing)
LLKEVGTNFAGRDLSAIDHMDDGGLIQLNISIDADKGEAIFDFEGTGSQVYDKDDSYLS